MTKCERKSLQEAGRSIIRDWLAHGRRSGPEALESIQKMLREVKVAFDKYMATREEPETTHWHENQCALFSIIRMYRNRKENQ